MAAAYVERHGLYVQAIYIMSNIAQFFDIYRIFPCGFQLELGPLCFWKGGKQQLSLIFQWDRQLWCLQTL